MAKYDEMDFCGELCLFAEELIQKARKPKWIPVTERLPEDDLPKDSKKKIIKVLVTYKTSNGVPVVRTNTRQKGRRNKSAGWDWAVSDPITHWMPLPETPKED